MLPWKPHDSTLRVNVCLTLCIQYKSSRRILLLCIVCHTVLSFYAQLQANAQLHKVNKILGFESVCVTQGAHDAVLEMPTLL